MENVFHPSNIQVLETVLQTFSENKMFLIFTKTLRKHKWRSQ